VPLQDQSSILPGNNQLKHLNEFIVIRQKAKEAGLAEFLTEAQSAVQEAWNGSAEDRPDCEADREAKNKLDLM